MKKISVMLVLILLVLGISGCSGLTNTFSKYKDGMTASDYVVILYSGGEIVACDIIRDGFVNNEGNSDGFYWQENGKLRKWGGTIRVEDIVGLNDKEIYRRYNIPENAIN